MSAHIRGDAVIPKISVVVPTYNHGKWLAECLDCIVVQQTSFPFEIIVGDDASPDRESRRILDDYAEKFPDLILPIRRKENVGAFENWIDLMRRARGEYIATCDGDDIMLQGKLQKQAEYLDAHPDFSMVGHPVDELKPDGCRIPGKAGFGKKVLYIDDILRNGTPFANSSVMFRKTHQTVWRSEKPVVDYMLHIDRAMCGPVGVMEETLGIHRADVGIYTTHSDSVEGAIRYAHDFAITRGCNPIGVNKSRMRFEMVFASERLMRGEKCFRGFREWDWGVWAELGTFRQRIGMAGAYLLRKWPILARTHYRCWVGSTYGWQKIILNIYIRLRAMMHPKK